ncbi:hypothetical protein ATKI12_6128 [Kitasatospora sp. Ki12]
MRPESSSNSSGSSCGRPEVVFMALLLRLDAPPCERPGD